MANSVCCFPWRDLRNSSHFFLSFAQGAEVQVQIQNAFSVAPVMAKNKTATGNFGVIYTYIYICMYMVNMWIYWYIMVYVIVYVYV